MPTPDKANKMPNSMVKTEPILTGKSKPTLMDKSMKPTGANSTVIEEGTSESKLNSNLEDSLILNLFVHQAPLKASEGKTQSADSSDHTGFSHGLENSIDMTWKQQL